MDISQLKKLAKNPHYKLSPEQLNELEAHRKKSIRHTKPLNKHSTYVPKHNPNLEDENGTR